MNSGPGPAGAGGGGAILIASSATITVTGAITANGGNGYSFSGGGSGGAIKLMANSISGNGLISARGGLNSGMGILGGEGRIRLEAYAISRSAGTDPEYTYGGPESVFVPNIPVLSITSIAGVSAPATPTGSYSLPDVLLPNTTVNPVTVTLSASNIPVGTTVIVSVIPVGGGATNVNTTLSGTLESSSASANVNISTGIVSVIMASATFTIQASMHWEGEKIEKAIARAAPGKKSETIFITESGKQVNAAKVFAGTMRAN